MYVYYDNSLREGSVEVGLFVHGRCFMYRIGPTLYASCENGINRCSTLQLVYIKRKSSTLSLQKRTFKHKKVS